MAPNKHSTLMAQEQLNTTRSFTKFTDLPADLQLMIWDEAARIPRVIPITYITPKDIESRLWGYEYATHPLMTTSQDARKALLKYSPISFRADFYLGYTNFTANKDCLFFECPGDMLFFSFHTSDDTTEIKFIAFQVEEYYNGDYEDALAINREISSAIEIFGGINELYLICGKEYDDEETSAQTEDQMFINERERERVAEEVMRALEASMRESEESAALEGEPFKRWSIPKVIFCSNARLESIFS